MLVGKWTVEGVLKSREAVQAYRIAFAVRSSGESIAQRFVRVREGGCVGIRRGHSNAVNQGGTAG